MCQSHRFFYSTFLFIDISIKRPSQVQVIVPYLIDCTQDSKYHRQGKTSAHRAPRADGQNGLFGEQPRVPLPSLQISLVALVVASAAGRTLWVETAPRR